MDDNNKKLVALLGGAYLLKKADERLDNLDRVNSEINKDVKNNIKRR